MSQGLWAAAAAVVALGAPGAALAGHGPQHPPTGHRAPRPPMAALPDFPPDAEPGACYARVPTGAGPTSYAPPAPEGQPVWTLRRGRGAEAVWRFDVRPGGAGGPPPPPQEAYEWARVPCDRGEAPPVPIAAPPPPPPMHEPPPPPRTDELLGAPAHGPDMTPMEPPAGPPPAPPVIVERRFHRSAPPPPMDMAPPMHHAPHHPPIAGGPLSPSEPFLAPPRMGPYGGPLGPPPGVWAGPPPYAVPAPPPGPGPRWFGSGWLTWPGKTPRW